MYRSSDAYARRIPVPTHRLRGGQSLKSTRLWLFLRLVTSRLGVLDDRKPHTLDRDFAEDIRPGVSVEQGTFPLASAKDAGLHERFFDAVVCSVLGTILRAILEFRTGQEALR